MVKKKLIGASNLSVSKQRQEALLNEYKGNLFEFLFGKNLAQLLGVEETFLLNLNENELEILNHQESFLRRYYLYLLKELPRLALIAAKETFSYCELSKRKIHSIQIIGKLAATKKKPQFEEADIVLTFIDNEPLLLSLKMSKLNAFVNTKSAGIKTFFSKYFIESTSFEIQDDFNQFIDTEFESFAISMHELKGIEYSRGFSTWEKLGLPVLPGELLGEEKKLLLSYYDIVTTKILNLLLSAQKENPKSFLKSLYSLLGFSHSKIIQVTAFYQVKDEKLNKEKVILKQASDDLRLNSILRKSNTIECDLGDSILQIRLKPMNKFTSKAYKLNCSVKYKD